jgi:hypothetical protein
VFESVGLDGTHLFALAEHVEGRGGLNGEDIPGQMRHVAVPVAINLHIRSPIFSTPCCRKP